MKVSKEVDGRITEAVFAGEEAFWAVIASKFPEATQGDFDPAAAHQFYEVLKQNVTLWLNWNTDLLK